jgi:hypothetical protein
VIGSPSRSTKTILASELRTGYTLLVGGSEREVAEVTPLPLGNLMVKFEDGSAPQFYQDPTNQNVIVVTTNDGF